MTDQTPPQPELVELAEQPTAVIAGLVEMAALPQFFDRAFPTLAQVLAAQDVDIAGPAFAFHHRRPTSDADLEVGFPTAAPVEPTGEVRPSMLPAGRAARLVHVGAYDGLGASWARLEAWIATEGLTPGETFWERYLTEPTPDTDPATLRTELFWPVT